LEELRNRLYLLDMALPKEALWNELSSSLVGMATLSGTALDSIVINKVPLSPDEQPSTKQNTETTSMPKGIIPMKFTVVARGETEKIGNLVELIERMRRINILNMVQISLTKEDNYQVTINAEAGYLPDEYVL